MTPELEKLIILIESNLHFIVREELTREQAIDIKRRLGLPLGLLNKKFEFRSDKEAKALMRNATS